MNYVVRITGPGIDHQVMVASIEDLEALELILAKIRRAFADALSGAGTADEGEKRGA